MIRLIFPNGVKSYIAAQHVTDIVLDAHDDGIFTHVYLVGRVKYVIEGDRAALVAAAVEETVFGGAATVDCRDVDCPPR